TRHLSRPRADGPAEKQSVDPPGAPPMEPLSLIERAVQHRESQAAVQKSYKTRRRARLLWRRTRGYAEIDAEPHQRWDHRRIPEHPVPGEMIPVPTVK